MTSPKVSCTCEMYGRVAVLEEALACFLRQDCAGEKELIILNDLASQELVFDHPEVRIVNIKDRYPTFGEKRNATVELATGDVIFPWSDDDLFLPWRISMSIKRMGGRQFWKPDKHWYWTRGKTPELKVGDRAHGMACFTKNFYQEVGGCPACGVGEDRLLEERMKTTNQTAPVQVNDIFYIYRWGFGGYHLSSEGRGTSGFPQADAWVKEHGRTGRIELQPHWNENYVDLCKVWAQTLV